MQYTQLSASAERRFISKSIRAHWPGAASALGATCDIRAMKLFIFGGDGSPSEGEFSGG